MITTDVTYDTLIASGSYEESITGTLKDGSGTTVLNISNEYIKTGSLIIDNKCINNDDLEPGAVYAAELKITITGNAGLTSSQKSALQNGSLNLTYTITDGNSSSSIGIGIYYIIEVKLKDEDTEIVAEDMMSRLSKNIPAAVRESLDLVASSPYELLDLCCQNCSTSKRPISLANDETEFESWCNADATFEIPTTADIATYRDLVAEVAKIMGCFATIDKSTNGLILKRLNPHSNSNVWTLNEDIRYSTEKSGYMCRFGKAALGSVSYPTTSDDNVSGLVLSMRATELTEDASGLIENLYNEMTDISYRPCKIDFMGNIALEVGDWIGVNYTEDNTTYTFRTIITHFTWILNGKELIEATGSSAATTKKVGSKGSNESRNSSSIDNLTNRIETLESSGSSKEVYYGTSLPTVDIGQDSSLYYKIIQRPEDLKTLNVVEYIQSARASYIPTDILMTNNTRIMMQGIFYQGDDNGGAVAFGINGNDSDGGVSRFVVGTSAFRNTSNCFFFFGDDYYGYRRSCEGIYGTDVMVMADTATRTFTISGGGTSHSVTVPSTFVYTPSSVPIGILCANMSSEAGGFEIHQDWRFMNENAIIKRFQVYYNNVLAYDLIPVQNANDVTDCGLYDRIHRKYYPGANYYNNTPFTAGTATGEVINQLDECVEAGYLRVNDEWWEIYNGGTEYFAGNYIEITENNVITSTLKAGTNIQIADDGTISASGADVTQIITSGTELATINGTSIYAPTTTVTQTLTEGTEIAQINGTSLYAPTGGGSDVTVTPITTTGTNIANIAVNGTTYNLFAPSGGGGGGGGSVNTDIIKKYSATLTSSQYNWFTFVDENGNILRPKDGVPLFASALEENDRYFTGLFWQNGDGETGSYIFRAGDLNKGSSLPMLTSPYTLTFYLAYMPYKVAVPQAMHHYSTDEQVVGTWIDGSTLYEKTQYGGITFSSQGTWYDTDITNIDKVVSVEGSIAKDGEPINIGYWSSSIVSTWILRDHTLKMSMQAMASGETYTLNSITVQYTKTS